MEGDGWGEGREEVEEGLKGRRQTLKSLFIINSNADVISTSSLNEP